MFNVVRETQNKQQTDTPKITDNNIYISTTEILRDYSLAMQSRHASIVGRREVLSGKAKFGIFGDGKEIPQLAMAKAFKKGDFRAGYYRDQTFMFATGMANLQQFFAQLYAHADETAEPHSAGRQMNSHFSTRSLNPDGSWKDLTEMFNSSPDLSPTAGQMPKLVGLGYASRLFRNVPELAHLTQFSKNGNEIAFGTIGNASCAEGHFWESINAIGVLKSPVVMSIWDDGFGISVSNEHQITKENISELLKGFQREPGTKSGFDIYTVRGWDYPALVETYLRAAQVARDEHVPSIIHVIEMTQPQGHSTSGSHERYKTESRLAWEEAFDGIRKMREWLIEQRIATAGELDNIERNAKKQIQHTREKAWKAFTRPIYRERQEAARLIEALEATSAHADELAAIRRKMVSRQTPSRKEILAAIHEALLLVHLEASPARQQLVAWKTEFRTTNHARYSKYLYGESEQAARHIEGVTAVYAPDAPKLRGFEILNHAFDNIFARDSRVVAFGEDLGKLGGVNQSMAGLQAKYGELRISDVGIRENTILGQAIGLALRGLRPIAEIQYLDYILYAIQTMSDDLATLHWRSAGGQKAPVIVRTRGHRLEGIWHAGSPMSAIVTLLRGMHVLVPRNMTQAAGFYNTLLKGDEPGLVIEVLNGYRLREPLPENIGEYTIPLGIPETVRTGDDITIVTYGACVPIAYQAAEMLAKVNIEAEIIDVRSLLPFDINHAIVDSLKKTSRILFLDEDVPGGTTAYMMQHVIEKQGGYDWLDSEPRTLAARDHRPSYGSDGGYFSKPSTEELFEMVYELMNEVDPTSYPIFYR
ncbi:MAG: transketolase [Chloroflexi bacterium]|nr:transketolase [Chloroflexota bacterium]